MLQDCGEKMFDPLAEIEATTHATNRPLWSAIFTATRVNCQALSDTGQSRDPRNCKHGQVAMHPYEACKRAHCSDLGARERGSRARWRRTSALRLLARAGRTDVTVTGIARSHFELGARRDALVGPLSRLCSIAAQSPTRHAYSLPRPLTSCQQSGRSVHCGKHTDWGGRSVWGAAAAQGTGCSARRGAFSSHGDAWEFRNGGPPTEGRLVIASETEVPRWLRMR